jgi:hypothetical protein
LRDAPPLEIAGAHAKREKREKRTSLWLFVGGGVIAAAAALLLFIRSEDSGVRLKGGGSSLGFFVKHEDAVRPGGSDEPVEPGDVLRFVATTREPRYLAVLSIDAKGLASVYYPEGPSAVRVETGKNVALPLSTVLDETLGRETIYGVFCLTTFETEPVRRSLEAAPTHVTAPRGCEVDVLHVRKEARSPR